MRPNLRHNSTYYKRRPPRCLPWQGVLLLQWRCFLIHGVTSSSSNGVASSSTALPPYPQHRLLIRDVASSSPSGTSSTTASPPPPLASPPPPLAELLNNMFTPHDIGFMLKIPVSMHFDDKWCWRGDMRGSVKHGYRSLSTVDDSNGSISWGSIWSLKLPPAVRNFLWRSMHNILPVLTVLAAHRVAVEGDAATKLRVVAVWWSIWRVRNEAVWNGKVNEIHRNIEAWQSLGNVPLSADSPSHAWQVDDAENADAMHAHVPNLLDNEGKWDLDFLRDIFYEQDLPRITSTPVSPSHSDASTQILTASWSLSPFGMLKCNIDAVIHANTVAFEVVSRGQ
nr:uncharacterized protein LOC109155280 [Ipomoea batatas]